VLGTFPTGGFTAYRIAFDRTNVWVINQDSGNQVTGNVAKLRMSDGELLGTSGVGTAPSGIAFDGAHIWVANAGGVFPGMTPSSIRKL